MTKAIKNTQPTEAALILDQVLFRPYALDPAPAASRDKAEDPDSLVGDNATLVSTALTKTSPLVGAPPAADVGAHQDQ